MSKLKVEYIQTEQLKPYANNAKIHTNEQIDQIKASIEEFGFNDPIAVWKENEIIEGHGRLLAAIDLGIEEIPIIRLDELSDEQRRAYMLVHNQLTMNTGFDFSALDIELENIDIDMEQFGFEIEGLNDWFEQRERNDTSRGEGNEEYNDFIKKFEPKKTTDDCYTPDVVYDAVAEWVAEEYGVKTSNFVRPFYPGGDYQSYHYSTNDVVVDNPPFSILAEIIEFYAENDIKFFLFAPTLTLFSSSSSSSSSICVGVTVTYENGANVNTSFLTNLEECRLRSAPTLYKAVNEANNKNLRELRRELPKYSYPDHVITSTGVAQFSKYGIDFTVPVEESEHIRQLESQKESGKAIFGSGYLVSDRIAKEREKAEREKAEREKAERWELSERERIIIRNLSQGGNNE